MYHVHKIISAYKTSKLQMQGFYISVWIVEMKQESHLYPQNA